ncbi:hypothetical protein ERJ75_001515200 [Trypanosoma vivax]|nr:hypothetical protein ERJ75_001515200 [Trypanosoma vivax]
METVADSENAPDLGIATRKKVPNICSVNNIVCSRRQEGVVNLLKIHGLERGCALELTKKARRAAPPYRAEYTCHVCGDAFERRGLLMDSNPQHPPNVVPADKERSKTARKEDTPTDGNTLRCPWCAKKETTRD